MGAHGLQSSPEVIEQGRWRRYSINAPWRPLDSSNGCSIQTPAACDAVRKIKEAAWGAMSPREKQLFPDGLRVLRAGYSSIQSGAWLRPHFGTSNGQLKMHLGLFVPEAAGTGCAVFRVGQAPSERRKKHHDPENQRDDDRDSKSNTNANASSYGDQLRFSSDPPSSATSGCGESELRLNGPDLGNSGGFAMPGECWDSMGGWRRWQAGSVLAFDDSIEHEVYFRGQCTGRSIGQTPLALAQDTGLNVSEATVVQSNGGTEATSSPGDSVTRSGAAARLGAGTHAQAGKPPSSSSSAGYLPHQRGAERVVFQLVFEHPLLSLSESESGGDQDSSASRTSRQLFAKLGEKAHLLESDRAEELGSSFTSDD